VLWALYDAEETKEAAHLPYRFTAPNILGDRWDRAFDVAIEPKPPVTEIESGHSARLMN
jgi:hypothetical protein